MGLLLVGLLLAFLLVGSPFENAWPRSLRSPPLDNFLRWLKCLPCLAAIIATWCWWGSTVGKQEKDCKRQTFGLPIFLRSFSCPRRGGKINLPKTTGRIVNYCCYCYLHIADVDHPHPPFPSRPRPLSGISQGRSQGLINPRGRPFKRGGKRTICSTYW